MGALTLASRVLPRWVGLAIIISLVLTMLVPLETHGPEGIVVNMLLSAGPIAAGVALWAEKETGEDPLAPRAD